jgi:hypothetical protein
MNDEPKLLSLNDLYELVKKVRETSQLVVKSDVPVEAHTKNVNGKRVQVKPYNQFRKDAAQSSGAIGMTGPKAHFAEHEEQPKLGGAIKQPGPAKDPFCVMCNPKIGDIKPVSGTVDNFTYMPPKNPLEGKTHDQISLDDIAQALHKHKVIPHPDWSKLSEEEKNQHIQNNAFKHLTPDAKIALKREIKKIVKPRFERAGKWMQLDRLGGAYDPETMLDDFADRIIEEMTPYERAGQKFGYKRAEDIRANPPKGKKVTFLYHKGMDPSTVNSAQDLAREARIRAPWWAKRFFLKEAGFEKYLGGPDSAIQRQNKLLSKISKKQKEIDKFKKKAGIDTGNVHIDTSVPYGLNELEKLADHSGYRIEKETNPQGNIQRVLLFEDDPESIDAFGNNKDAIPQFSVEFDKGGKPLDEVRDKLAKLINPAETPENTPLKQYHKLHDELKTKEGYYNDILRKKSSVQDEYERESVEPNKHYERISTIASDAYTSIESLNYKLPAEEQKKIDEVSIGITSALEYFEGQSAKDFSDGFKELKSAENAAKNIKAPEQFKGETAALLTNLIGMRKEAEAFRDKKMMNPAERENKLDALYDKLKDLEDATKQASVDVPTLKSQLDDLKNIPEVAEYDKLQTELQGYRDNLNDVKPHAEALWHESLSKLDNDGGEVGDYADAMQYEKWKQAQHEAENPDSGADWEENIPDDVDLNDEQAATEAGKNILQALKHNQRGSLLFGGEGHKKGLVHIAHNLISDYLKNGKMQDYVNKVMQEHPYEGKKVPEFYKNYAMLGDSRYHRWKKLHDMDPGVISKYSLMFSDYNPVPYSMEDVFDNTNGQFDELLDNLRSINRNNWHKKLDENGKIKTVDGEPEWEFRVPESGKKATVKTKEGNKTIDLPEHMHGVIGNKKVFEWQYFNMLRLLGNDAIKQMTQDNPDQRAILDKMRDLNRPDTKSADKSKRAPGQLRRDLARRMDVLYGRYAKDFPDQWPHNYSNDLDHWLNKIGVVNQEEEYKSHIVYGDRLRKSRATRLIVRRA